MQYYPEDFKKAMVVKMTAPGAQSATSLAKETDIPQSTLSRWLRSYATVPLKGKAMRQRRPQEWSAEEKLEALLGDRTRTRSVFDFMRRLWRSGKRKCWRA